MGIFRTAIAATAAAASLAIPAAAGALTAAASPATADVVIVAAADTGSDLGQNATDDDTPWN